MESRNYGTLYTRRRAFNCRGCKNHHVSTINVSAAVRIFLKYRTLFKFQKPQKSIFNEIEHLYFAGVQTKNTFIYISPILFRSVNSEINDMRSKFLSVGNYQLASDARLAYFCDARHSVCV